MAVAGLYLLALADFSQVNLGDILATICAVGFALQVAYTAKHAFWAEALPLVTVQVTFVAAASLILSLVFEPWNRLMTTQIWAQPGIWVAVWVTSLFATVLAYAGQTHFQRFTNPTRVALIFSMEPVFAALTDYWWLGTAITGWSLVGCALILTGMVIAELPAKFYQNRREGTTCEQKPLEY